MADKGDMIKKGKLKYEAGINRMGGEKTWLDCGARGGMNTAVCLKTEKETRATASNWAKSWETAMNV